MTESDLSIGSEFLRLAREDRRVRLELAKDLLPPQPFYPKTPRIPRHELAVAINTLEHLADDWRPGSSANQLGRIEVERWQYMICRWIAQERTPLTSKGISVTQRVFQSIWQSGRHVRNQQFREICHCEVGRPPTPLNGSILWQALERRKAQLPASLKRPVESAARHARRFSEHRERIVAVYNLLQACRERNPAVLVWNLLEEHYKFSRVKPESIHKLVSRYGNGLKSGRCWIPLDLLHIYWLDALGRCTGDWSRYGVKTLTREDLAKLTRKMPTGPKRTPRKQNSQSS